MISILLNLILQFTQPAAAPTRLPNVIVIVLDDVGVYDIARVQTPTIDDLANRGRNFTRAYAMPICAPSRATMMYGIYDESLGPTCSDIPTNETPLSNTFSITTPFKSNGYRTAYFGKWHLGTNRDGLPWEMTPQTRGFDDTFAIVPGNLDVNCDGFAGDYYNWLAVENGVSYIEHRYHTLVLRDKFIDWWTRTRGPKFAVVSFQAAHSPFQEPPQELLPYLPKQDFTPSRFAYEKLIITIDYTLSQILSFVDVQDTYIIIVGDNGTPPNAIGPGQDRNKVKTSPYEGGINVPLIITGPGIVSGNSNSLATIADIAPTFADMFGLDIPQIDGVSLVPVLKDPSTVIHEYVFASNNGDRAIIQSRYKLVRLNNIERFFDLESDPTESNPLDPNTLDTKIVDTMRSLMAEYIARGL